MPPQQDRSVWFWTTLLLSCFTILSIVFATWELIEQRFFRDLNFTQLHYLYITRGVGSSLLLAAWAVWFVLRERRKTEDELRSSRERYWAMLAHVADAVVLLDHRFTVLEWNPQAVSMYGFSRDSVLGKLVPTIGPGEREELERVVGSLAQGDPVVEIETRRQNQLCEWIDVGLRVTSFLERQSGQTVIMEMAMDLREKKRLRAKALEMEKLTSMGRMAAGTAHTLNTPLAAMLLRIEVLRDRLEDDKSIDILRHLESSTRFCQEFVQKLLQYSRPTESTFQVICVAELLNSIHTFFKPTFDVKKHELCCVTSGLHKTYIRADRSQMEALFAALLMNALDALPVSDSGRVVVGGNPHEGQVEMYVSDDGSGVPEQTLPRISDPFFTTKKAGKGTGLGLSIAANIVQDHGGTIKLANQQPSGFIVCIRLPRCESPDSGKSVQTQPLASSGVSYEYPQPDSNRR